MEMPQLHAVIGVWFDNGRTFYVKRSAKMANYPNTWSLLSIQFNPNDFDPRDEGRAAGLFRELSRQRLGGAEIEPLALITSANCRSNPIDRHVFLHMYLVDVKQPPVLNPDFYSTGAWLTPAEYRERSSNSACGLCTRMWSDYSFSHGLSSERFAPQVSDNIDFLLGVGVAQLG